MNLDNNNAKPAVLHQLNFISYSSFQAQEVVTMESTDTSIYIRLKREYMSTKNMVI